ncbi:GH92 family glycosyl hydrolase [Sphingomonas elodea]|uniref:GH92 family glycosyl hydrolase n=2 Tax=Pseudomonadota TaxID=1224 RepID=UPI0002630436|nr:GH92 family glycosyl hydrolase [Sphingomonas elodea]
MRLFSTLLLSAALFVPPAASQQAASAQDAASRVDPFVGVDGGGVAGGNTVPGAGVPFGFVSFSPDTTNGDTNGYDSHSPIMGFSYTHVSGTGGSAKYGNFRVTPISGDLRVAHLHFARSEEHAAPGIYRVGLRNTEGRVTQVELTATRLAGFQRLTFPEGAPAHVVLDASSVIAMRGSGQRTRKAHVQLIDDRHMAGWTEVEGGWNPVPYKLYFYAEFDRPALAFGAWKASQGRMETLPGAGEAEGGTQTKAAADRQALMIEYDTRMEFAHRLGTYFTFDPKAGRQVRMKLAVSFLGIDKARANLAAELPDWDFDAAAARARGQWNAALGKIEVEGGTEEQRRIFTTALYRTHTMPHDLTGENVWWQSAEPHYEDFYTLWDTFRTVHPLLTLIQPERQRGMIRSLIDTYAHTGWMPDARIAGGNGMTQGGSNGDVVIADAVVKGLGGFDIAQAYQALVKNAEVESDAPFLQGRVLEDYKALGYVSVTQTRSASRTLEYAYDDFAIGAVASQLGKTEDAARYRTRAGNWRNLWDERLGCIRPRYPDGSWLENYSCTDEYPDRSTPWWEAPFYEGNALQYSTYVPHDVAGLMARTGGTAGFVAWLDRLFDGHYSQGNEPDILAPYLYIHAGRPDRTAAIVRELMARHYHLTRTGLPGNDDAGAMSSWYVWNAMGLYPNAGQPYYYIASPIFARSRIALEGGRSFTVVARDVSEANRYVVAASLNGKPIDRAWIAHAELIAGGTLELQMGAAPSAWATRFTAPPDGYRR